MTEIIEWAAEVFQGVMSSAEHLLSHSYFIFM